MQTIIVGLGHKARSGKGKAAEFITEAYDEYDIRSYGFSEELKRDVLGRESELCIEHGVTYDMNPDRTDPICTGPAGKQVHLLQFWGQYKRQQDAFYWIHKLARRISEDQPQVALVTDLRYKNEAAWIKSQGGYVLKIERPGFVDPSRDPNHISEVDLDGYKGWDYVVSASNLDDLRTASLQVFQMILDAISQVFLTTDFTERAFGVA